MTLSVKPIVWTIAASDSAGGAGIQADVKTFFDLGVHGCSAITAITAQNTQGVHHTEALSADVFDKQLQALADDLPPKAIKIGVLSSVESIQRLRVFFQQQITIASVPVIYDPVLAPTHGSSFVDDDIIRALKQLLPFIDVLTPNIPEAERLTGITIHNTETQLLAAQALITLGASAVLLKGGHGNGEDCQDLLCTPELTAWLTQRKYNTPHSHGTGCVLSSAVTAFMAQGKPMRDAVVLANAYINKGLQRAQPFDAEASKRGAVAQTGWPDDLRNFPQVSVSPTAIHYPDMPSCDHSSLGLYPVVDTIEWLEKLLVLGVKTIQLRVKEVPADELDTMIARAAALGRQYQARLFINDYWELAIKHHAYGVHLGQEDMVNANIAAIHTAGLRLGISTHGEYEFSYAATFKPSYLAIGAIFPTDTKEVIEVGLDNLYRWAGILGGHYPLVAIGGINQTNIELVLASGVGSIAVVSAITKADDYVAAVQQLSQAID
jgi:hydroxymethylpyrimidine kinase/phosphomethylpyrimidine kinase/thiamine-phosphate diphosphorylase